MIALLAVIAAAVMLASLQAAIALAFVYYTIGRLLDPGKRALGSGLITGIFLAAYVLWQASEFGPLGVTNPEVIAACLTYFAGLALWVWRTHAADRREALKS